MVPLVDLKAQYLSIKEELDAAVAGVISRATFIEGEEVALFEREFADYCGAKETVSVGSGTDALRLALLAAGIGPGDEVITTPLTFTATAEAICQIGARPVFVDIVSDTCNINADEIASAITEKTRAILPVHLHGNPANMTKIMEIARSHGLKVIEDAAQAHGARYKDRHVGTFGDAGCFSFFPSNNLGTFGNAGAVITDDPDLAKKVRLLRNHGRIDKYDHACVGYNSRMGTIQAAVLRVKLPFLDQWNELRRAIAEEYRSQLSDSGVEFISEEPDGMHVYHRYVIRTSQRGHWRRALTSAGIETGLHFPVPLHLQPAYKHLRYQSGDFSASEEAAGEVLSLPIYPEMPIYQVAEITKIFDGRGPQSLEQHLEVAAGS